MVKNKKVLVVDDELSIRELLSVYFRQAGYDVVEADNGEEAVKAVHGANPDIVILDIMMPVLNGIEACIQIRKLSDVPVIMLTARTQDYDRILGFEVGVDDYVAKPFNPQELVARVKAVLRRTNAATPEVQQTIILSGLEISLSEHQVKAFEQSVPLTNKELEVLWHLASNQGKVLSREQLLELVWDYSYMGDTRTVDTHVKRLRKKLGASSDTPWDIKTIWGIGYKFEVRP